MQEVIIHGKYPNGAQYAEYGVGACTLYLRGYSFVLEFRSADGKREVMFTEGRWPTDPQLQNWINFARQMRFGKGLRNR